MLKWSKKDFSSKGQVSAVVLLSQNVNKLLLNRLLMEKWKISKGNRNVSIGVEPLMEKRNVSKANYKVSICAKALKLAGNQCHLSLVFCSLCLRCVRYLGFFNGQLNSNGKSRSRSGSQSNGQYHAHLKWKTVLVSNGEFRDSKSRIEVKTVVIKSQILFSNRFLLIRCGDVELNPGPIPVPNDLGGLNDSEDDDVQQVHGQEQRRDRDMRKLRSDLQVVTYNVRGLADRKKVRHVVNKCYKLTSQASNSFFMFQETFVTRLDILNYLWRGEYHLTPGNGNSRGCLTLITSPYKIINASDFGDRAHVVVVTENSLDKAERILVNVYAPNGYDNEKITFFEALAEKISDTMAEYNCSNVILAGDLNLVFSEDELQNRLYSNAERRVASSVKNLLGDLNLQDGWETAQSKSFTWSSNRLGHQTSSTLDRVLYTRDHLDLLDKTVDWAMSLSDHAAVTASFRTKRVINQKASQISRLDPRLLMDPQGRLHLEARFGDLRDQALDEWNPHVRLEYFKMCIRTAVNDANGKLKAQIRDTEVTLNEDINHVVSELARNDLTSETRSLLMYKLDDLRQLKRNLIEKIGTRLEQKAARKWYNEGELSNKYFFNLLNRRANSEINVILADDGAEINEPEQIEMQIRNFYKDLYESVPDRLELNDDFFRNVPQVSPIDANAVMEDLTIEELTATLQKCIDSAPGPDGIPYSYLKFFWRDFGPVLLESWKYSLRTKNLPPSHKVSLLRLIPKAGKDSRVISNLRPITLSNTDHKLITKTYAHKLTKIVAGCIGEEQTAYIPGRLINDNLRAMLMTIDLANVDLNVKGTVVSLDAKKAFDSVDHRYIKKCLSAFGLDRFVAIFDVLYKQLKSDIIFNGKVFNGYQILRGVKQGDALSCIIFIMCMEPLIRKIKANVAIEPIESQFLRINIPKVYSFADDVTVLTKNEDRCIQEIFCEYEKFTKASGLLLNAEKTEILCFNGHRQRDARSIFNVNYNGVDYHIQSMERIKVNGLILLQQPSQREEVNAIKAS